VEALATVSLTYEEGWAMQSATQRRTYLQTSEALGTDEAGVLPLNTSDMEAFLADAGGGLCQT